MKTVPQWLVSSSLLPALVALAAWTGCDEPKPTKSSAPAATSATETPKEKPFELPAADDVKLPQVGDWVDRARSKLPAKEVGKIDAWLKKVVHVPVEIRGESKKTLSDTGELTCGYDEKMTCSFPGKLSRKAKYFVASTLVCVTRTARS